MAIEPLEYARPKAAAREYDPIRFTQTETGFLLEVVPPPANQQFGCALAAIALGMIAVTFLVAGILTIFIVAGAAVILVVDKRVVAKEQEKRASFELDGGAFIAHHKFKEVLVWREIEHFDVHLLAPEARIAAVTRDEGGTHWETVYRSDDLADIKRIARILNDEKEKSKRQA